MLKDTALYRSLRRLIKGNEIQRRFIEIYHQNGFAGRDSASGPGSDLSQTAALREALPELLRQISVRSMLDAPCGDFFWMQAAQLELDRYIGADIVPELIAEDQRKYQSDRRDFRVLDITSDPLPQVDLIFCRDCLVHLPFSLILAALRNFKRSGPRYLLTTTFTARTENTDIPLGLWRPINLQLPPFGLPAPQRILSERCTENDGQYADKSMALWEVSLLPELQEFREFRGHPT